MSSVIDQINQHEMRKAEIVHHYSVDDFLSPAEQAAVDRVAAQVRGGRVLDIGVGGGRTVNSLLKVSADYLGVDNSPEMISACQRRFPGVKFELADARQMPDLPDGSVTMAMFSCNGIGMVSHEDRLLIMREVFRILKPGGLFLFSTHNKHCPDESAGLKLPEFRLSPNPARTLVRLARYGFHTVRRVYRRSRLRKFEIRTAEYSIVNDVCHDYGVMLYYITLASQREQLERIGFDKGAEAYDLAGKIIATDSTDSSIMVIARKPTA